MARWRAAQIKIGAACRALSEVSLLVLERKLVYKQAQFTEAQELHRAQVKRLLTPDCCSYKLGNALPPVLLGRSILCTHTRGSLTTPCAGKGSGQPAGNPR